MLPIEELREEIAQRQQFMMMVAHEMRNLLAPLTCGVELLASADTAATIRVRPAMARQVAQMTRLVDDLLDIASSEQGRLSLCVASVDLRDVIAAAIDIAQPTIAARQHCVTLTPSTGSPAVIEGDQCRLTQVLSNLLINAAKFTPKCGDIHVLLESDTPFVKLCVRDTGIGITADMLPNIFNVYVRSVRGPDGTRSGLGLGLAVARHLVELHGGSLCAYSAGPGKGSEFVMRLPVAASC
jgi:signal transduction histidine kinase